MGKVYKHTPTAPVKFSAAKGGEFWRNKSSWFTLAFFELSVADRAYALEQVLRLTTGKKVIAFVNSEHKKSAAAQFETACYWSYRVLDKLGECIVVHYRGVAIRLLYKRTVLEHPITELEPVSDKPAIDADDAWIYLDLTGSSAKQAHAPTLVRLKELEEELTALKKRIASQDDVIIETDREAYNRAVAYMQEENSRVLAILEKVEHQVSKIPAWVVKCTNQLKGGGTVKENSALYGVAKQVCHEFGMDWTDPRNGKTYKAPKKAIVTRVNDSDNPVAPSVVVTVEKGGLKRETKVTKRKAKVT